MEVEKKEEEKRAMVKFEGRERRRSKVGQRWRIEEEKREEDENDEKKRDVRLKRIREMRG